MKLVKAIIALLKDLWSLYRATAEEKGKHAAEAETRLADKRHAVDARIDSIVRAHATVSKTEQRGPTDATPRL